MYQAYKMISRAGNLKKIILFAKTDIGTDDNHSLIQDLSCLNFDDFGLFCSHCRRAASKINLFEASSS